MKCQKTVVMGREKRTVEKQATLPLKHRRIKRPTVAYVRELERLVMVLRMQVAELEGR